jgi:hypothetical protein
MRAHDRIDDASLITIAGCVTVLGCARTTESTTHGYVVGGSPERALRVA